MKVSLLTSVKTSLGLCPAMINDAPCVVDLPDDEARRLINQYKAKLTTGEDVNFSAEKKAKA